ncbi:transglycosylase family protein [Streptomyces lunalinharesii]|uniref:Transglycosylase family protein n=1 Tax=Streptomyces lunalinharesii TaxID=333384 RepID=A0ABN3RLC1_9ACTN
MSSPLAGRTAGPLPSAVRALLPVLLLLGAAVASADPAAAAPPPSSGTDWDQIAACESSGNWHTNTGNGYHGGLQIAPSTWRAYGGDRFAPRADLASRAEQIAIGERIAQDRGLTPWPNCGGQGTATGDRAASGRDPGPPAADEHRTPPRRGTYTVRPGDCLSGIADHTDAPGGTRNLYTLNRARLRHGPDRIYPGQRLRLT